jgi:ABC-type phosphate/phosphonate transport system substrate-binding protein
MNRTIMLLFALLTCSFCAPAYGGDKEPKANGSTVSPVRIAVVDSFFRDIPEPLVRPVIEPFRVLMMAQTGMDGDIVMPKNALQLAQDLADDKVQIALFHGFEYAWAKRLHPDLRPMMIALHQRRELQVFLMVRADSPVRSFAELQGKPVALPCFCQEHCWIYMERACQAAGQADPKKFFSSFTTPRDPEEGLDELADGKVQAVIVDNVALDSYQKRKPARFAKLKCVQKSEMFPSAVIAYRAGSFDEATVKRFQESLLGGQKTALGRQLLTLWKLRSLENVPADFDESLNRILKAYPPPENRQADKEKPADGQTVTRRLPSVDKVKSDKQ